VERQALASRHHTGMLIIIVIIIVIIIIIITGFTVGFDDFEAARSH
jgi:uncharacterized protein YpmB